jgi:5-methylthioadenosine/S-adenosylhomocysteine deaminase
MLFSDIGLITDQFTYEPHAYVGVDGSHIAYVGTEKPERTFGEEYDGRGKVLMPGMVNAHSHAPMTLMRGYAENLALDDWLNTMIFPFEAQIHDEDAYPATLLAIAEMLCFGTTSFSDMYYFNDARAKAILGSGIKCNLCHTVLDFEGTPYEEKDDAELNRRLVRDYHGAGDGRLLIDMGLHAEYTSNPTTVRTFAEETQKMGLRMQVHVSETAKEVAECKERHEGRTPVKYLADMGLFDNPTTAAHCVWLEGDDYAILADKDVTVASNPVSNAKLGSGIVDLAGLQKAGVRVALGTDSVASNNNLNMFQDMTMLGLVTRAKDCTPVGVSASELLQMATRNGALSQGRQGTGVIAEGMRADLAVLDVDTPWMQPVSDMVTNLVYSAQGSDVVLTMVDGDVLYRDGVWPTIDIERAKAETAAARKRVLARL